MKMVFWRAKMLIIFGLIEVQNDTVRKEAARSTYNGHLSTFSACVLLIPEALGHNFVKGKASPK